MKRYLTLILIGVSVVTVIIGYKIDTYWSGMATWAIVILLLTLAIYFIKFIPNDKNENHKK